MAFNQTICNNAIVIHDKKDHNWNRWVMARSHFMRVCVPFGFCSNKIAEDKSIKIIKNEFIQLQNLSFS